MYCLITWFLKMSNIVRICQEQSVARLTIEHWKGMQIDKKGYDPKQFAIRACKEGTPNAFVFSKPKGEQKYQITVNNAVIAKMIRKMAGWSDDDGNWNIPGVYLTDEEALVYDLKTAIKPRSKGGGWAVKRQREAEAAEAAEN